MKRIYMTTALTCLLTLAVFGYLYAARLGTADAAFITVGFIYEDDESTPYTYNFSLAEQALQEEYPGRIMILSRSNVPAGEVEEPLRELARQGCAVIFTNSHSTQFAELAEELPGVQICQVSYLEDQAQDGPENYHTFKGEITQGRYVSGIAAGMKLRELMDGGLIAADEALAGYVGAYPSEEVIAGYTAFLDGIRTIVPETQLEVRYTETWGNYSKEKACAKELIDLGCVAISQHTDTIGPAIACEEAAGARPVFFVGYNQSMLDVAPTTALISTRINWTPYIREAVEAVRRGARIEEYVSGKVNGNEITAGFDLDWVQMLELNAHIAAEGTQQAIDQAIETLKKD